MQRNLAPLRPSAAALLMAVTAALGSRAAQAHGASDVDTNPAPELQEVIVTAQKRPENILTVPESVSLISGTRLEQQHATGLQDIAANVPGLQIDSSGTPGQTTITLRGIAPIGSGAAVGTYIDGAPLGSSGLYALSNSFQLDLMPYDLKNVQILRGPQGTLYGASTMGGLIKYELQKPDSKKLDGAVGGDLIGIKNGRTVGGGGRGMVNIPIINGKLAMRASAFYETTPGYIDDPVRHARGDNAVRETGGRIAFGWTPTANLDIEIEALRQQISADDDAVVTLDPTGSRPPLGDLSSNLALAQPFEQTIDFFEGSLNWMLPKATLTSVSSYSQTHNVQWQDASPVFQTFFEAYTGAPGYSQQFVDIELHKATEELRLTSTSGGPLEWMVGTFLTTERVANTQAVTALGPTFQQNILNPLLTVSLPSRYSEEAGFADLTWHIIGGWSVSGGARYSHNSQHFEQITGGLLSLGAPVPGQSNANVVTYSGSTQYQFTSKTMAYVRVATGYQPGGPNVALTGVPPTVQSSTLINYEAGVKSETLDDRLRLDLTVFRMDWKRIQTIATTPTGIQYLLNAGKARSQGIEAEATLRPTRRLSLQLSFAYTDAKFIEAVPTLGTAAGQRLPLVPRVSGAARAQYAFPLAAGWVGDISGTFHYEGSRPAYLFVAPSPPVTFPESSYGTVGLNLDASRDGWTIGLFAKNLFDKRAYVTETGLPDALTGSVVQVNAAVLQPRVIGLSVDRRF